MNQQLWTKILEFRLDNPNDEYGFSTRLVIENRWTLSFTESAILEYKKFMYLAATSTEMVSPSEIVDIVWHQHLIFTLSYDEFCKLLSKKIEHIPSTHNKDEKERFGKARARTKELYEANFGQQPAEIWDFHNELVSLGLEPSKYKWHQFSQIPAWIFIAILIVLYFVLCPIVVKIENPYFLIYYGVFSILSFLFLELIIRKKSQTLVDTLKSNPIIRKLSAFELIMLRSGKIEYVLHCVMNSLISKGKIEIQTTKRLNLIDDGETVSQYENCIIEIMKGFEPIPYTQLIRLASKKPIFEQLNVSTERLRSRIQSSKDYVSINLMIYLVLSLLFGIGIVRFVLGIVNDRPILYLTVALIILTIARWYYLKKRLNYFFDKALPDFYQHQVLDSSQKTRWEWNYFLYGDLVLLTSFIPIAGYANRNHRNQDNYGTGCGTSCGSSCGSSCGGGGGCGGCGGGD